MIGTNLYLKSKVYYQIFMYAFLIAKFRAIIEFCLLLFINHFWKILSLYLLASNFAQIELKNSKIFSKKKKEKS